MPQLSQRICARFQGIEQIQSNSPYTTAIFLLRHHSMWLTVEEQKELGSYLYDYYGTYDTTFRWICYETSLSGSVGRQLMRYRPTEDDPEVWAIPCPACGEDMPEWCSGCRQGMSCGCCECYACNNCSHRVSDPTCGDCDCCSACCRCHSDDQQIEQGDEIHNVETVADRKLFNSKRLAGIEVEYNSAATFSAISRFCQSWGAGVHEDGSCGWEVVSAPAAGNHLVNQITALGRALADAEASVDNTCGVHVHVDARDYTWNEMRALLQVWNLIEAPMYILAGAHRRGRHYCKPYGAKLVATNKDTIINSVVGYASNKEMRHDRGERTFPKKGIGDARYRSLNICPWLARNPSREIYDEVKGCYRYTSKETYRAEGKSKLRYKHRIRPDSTVEFRLHEGCHDAGELLNWTKLCVRIVEWCSHATDKDIKALGHNGMRALAAIAPDLKPYLVARMREYHRQCLSHKRNRFIGIRNGGYHLDPKWGWAKVRRGRAVNATADDNDDMPF